jgi:hypothetical protein
MVKTSCSSFNSPATVTDVVSLELASKANDDKDLIGDGLQKVTE